MAWEKRDGPIQYGSQNTQNTPIDMDSPPAVGDIALLLTKDGYEFNVEIKSVAETGLLSGVVTSIGPVPAIEASGINRCDNVEFHETDIHRLARA